MLRDISREAEHSRHTPGPIAIEPLRREQCQRFARTRCNDHVFVGLCLAGCENRGIGGLHSGGEIARKISSSLRPIIASTDRPASAAAAAFAMT